MRLLLNFSIRSIFFLSLLGLCFSMTATVFADRIEWSQLGLTPQQTVKIQALEQQWRKTYREVHPNLIQKRQKLRQLMESPNANTQDVMMVQQQIQNQEQFLRQEATKVFMQKKQSLTIEQRKSLQGMMQPESASR